MNLKINNINVTEILALYQPTSKYNLFPKNILIFIIIIYILILN